MFKSILLRHSIAGLALAITPACSDDAGQSDSTGSGGTSGAGGAFASGGASAGSGGAFAGTGGALAGTGGAFAGGATSTGGAFPATGGALPATGGSGGAGGVVGSGGAVDGGAGPGTGGVPATGGAPGNLEEVNVAVEGPHTFATFTEGAKAPEYAQGLVYYPNDADGPFPVMLLSPGFTASNTDYEVWGRVLASHGIVAVLIQPTSVFDTMPARAADLRAGLGIVRGALNTSGPLAGKIDTAAVGFMGHSMGGGGTLIAANQAGNDIQAAIPLQPYEPGARFPNIVAPTLIIAAERDTVATVSGNAFPHYESIPATTTKIYMEAAGADHYYSTDRFEASFEMNARYAIAFLKVYLEGDMRYETYLYGAEHQAVESRFSRYLTSP